MSDVGSAAHTARMFGSAKVEAPEAGAPVTLLRRRVHDVRQLNQQRSEARVAMAEFIRALSDRHVSPAVLAEIALRARRAADLVWGAAARLAE